MAVPCERLQFRGAAGNNLAADASGPLDGPPVLLLHGGGQTRHSWAKARVALAGRGYRAISIDARGHGESDWIANGDYSFQAQINDLLCLIEQVAGRPALVGASMGGVNALVACGLEAANASALVLVDVAPRLEPGGIEHIVSFMTRHVDGFATLQEAAEAVAAYNPGRTPSRDLAGLSKNLRKRDNGRWYWHWDPRFMSGDHDSKIQTITHTMLKAAKAIELPTLLVRGKQSDVVSPQGAAELKTLISHLEFVDIEGAGHMVAGDKNDHFNQAIFDFLARHYPVGQGHCSRGPIKQS